MKRTVSLLFSPLFFAACQAPSESMPEQPATPPPPAPAQVEIIEEEVSEVEVKEEETMMEEEKMMEEGAMESEETKETNEAKEEMPLEEEMEDEVEEQEESTTETTKHTVHMFVEDWEFSPETITVKKGEELEIVLEGVSGDHGFGVPKLGINVPLEEGETKTVAIPTDKAGTFHFLCTVPCGSGHSDMRGTIVIQE